MGPACRWINWGREGYLAGHTLGRLEGSWGITHIPNRSPGSSRERSCRSSSCSSLVSVRKARAGCQVLGCCSGADKSLYLPLLSFSSCHQQCCSHWFPFAVTPWATTLPFIGWGFAPDWCRQLCWFSYSCSKERGIVCFLHFLLKRAFYQNKNSPGEFSSSVSLPLYQCINTNSTVTFLTNIRGLQ